MHKFKEDTRFKNKNMELKKATSYNESAFNGKLEIQYKPRLKKIVFNQNPSNFPKIARIGCLNLGPKRQRVVIHLARNLLVPSVVTSI